MSIEVSEERTTGSAPSAAARAVRSFAGLATGEAVARAIAFVATLLIARRLGPAMYGIIGVTSGIMLYCTQVADAGVELAGVPAIARERDDPVGLISAVLTLRVLAAIVLTVLVVAVGLWLMPQPDGAILAVYALGLVVAGASPRWVFLGFQRPGTVAIARIAGELATLVIVAAMVHDAGQVAIVPLATVLGLVLGLVLMMGGLHRMGLRPVLKIDWPRSKPIFTTAPHLVGFTLLGLVLFNFDLIFLRFVAGETPAGYYAAAYTFIAFSANLIVAWAHSVMPSLARLSGSPRERNEVYATTTMLGLSIALPAAVGGILTAPLLLGVLFGQEFAPAATALQWLLPVVPLAAVREIAVAALISSPGGERRLLKVNAWTAAFNVALVTMVVPWYGLVGAAAVTVLTEVLRLVLAARFAREHHFEGPSLVRYGRPALAAALMAAGLLVAGPDALVPRVVAGVGYYAVGLVLVGAIRIEDGRRLRVAV
ncbi:MAG TPA: oligosaccharide flippase family protein [Gemmatimonadaceae bacterium]